MEGSRHSFWGEVAALSRPATVVSGRPEGFSPSQFAEQVAGHIPGGVFERHPDLGHFGPQQAPGSIARSIDAALLITALLFVTAVPYHGPMALELPRTLSPSQGLDLQRLRPGVPVLGHRSPARAALAPPPRARWCTSRSSACSAPRGPHPPARRPGMPGRGHRGRRERPRSSPALDLDADGRGGLPGRGGRAVDRSDFELEDPRTIHAHRARAAPGGAGGGPAAARASSTGSSSTHDGGLVVTDYKTAAPPARAYQQGKLGGVAVLLAAVRGAVRRAPGAGAAAVPGRHHGDHHRAHRPVHPRACAPRWAPLWQAVEQACEREDFRPSPGRCATGATSTSYCPAQGGDPSQAAVQLGERPARAA